RPRPGDLRAVGVGRAHAPPPGAPRSRRPLAGGARAHRRAGDRVAHARRARGVPAPAGPATGVAAVTGLVTPGRGARDPPVGAPAPRGSARSMLLARADRFAGGDGCRFVSGARQSDARSFYWRRRCRAVPPRRRRRIPATAAVLAAGAAV